MANVTAAQYNLTLVNNHDLCTIQTCPIDWASISYVPSLPGNAFFAAVFAACLFGHVVLGFWYRTWGFLVTWIFGLGLEVLGYAARIWLHSNIFASNPFLM